MLKWTITTAIAATSVLGFSHDRQSYSNHGNSERFHHHNRQNPAPGNLREEWLSAGKKRVNELRKQARNQLQFNKAKNVILFVGDGMGVSTVTAARIYKGQQNDSDASGEEHVLEFERWPSVALSKTYNTNQQTPDSAGTMTAMITGVKTKAGVLSVGPAARRRSCEDEKRYHVPSLIAQAESIGWSTGIVTTARVTHATPAATYANTTERGDEADAHSSECDDIATQLITFQNRIKVKTRGPNRSGWQETSDGIDVILGGGKTRFQPSGRQDEADLIAEWKELHNPNVCKQADRNVVNSKQELHQIEPGACTQVLGLFSDSHLPYTANRTELQQQTIPTLAEMTTKALDILSSRKRKARAHGRHRSSTRPFFLLVESGRIDHGHHAGKARLALEEAAAFDDAINAAIQHRGVDLSETLIIVTADHSHVFTIAGYPQRGNPILGYVRGVGEHGAPLDVENLAADGLPYTTLGYMNGPGSVCNNRNEAQQLATADTEAIAKIRDGCPTELPGTNSPDYYQQALIPFRSETHGAEDVAIYATGAGSYLVRGVIEQNVLFHIMTRATGLDSPSYPFNQSGKFRYY